MTEPPTCTPEQVLDAIRGTYRESVPVEVCARTFRHQLDAFAAARVYFGDTLLCSLPAWLRWREPQVTRIFHCGTCGAPFLRG